MLHTGQLLHLSLGVSSCLETKKPFVVHLQDDNNPSNSPNRRIIFLGNSNTIVELMAYVVIKFSLHIP